MWVNVNPNPQHKHVPDSIIRAVCFALKKNWYQVFDELCGVARRDCNMPSSDTVWSHYLYMQGFEPFQLPETCPRSMTVQDFAQHYYPNGTYIIGTGSHAVAVIDGDYYDSWDSGDEIPSFFWKTRSTMTKQDGDAR